MNIKSISDLLHEFESAETEILNQQNVKHPTTIGSMYEGLTENILNAIVFNDLCLNVVKNSFIDDCDTEFDIMLVEGDGQQIPYTNRYKYNAKQVIAIIQVKKNLYSQDIKDGYENLKFIVDSYDINNEDMFINRLFRDGVRSICKIDINTEDISTCIKHIKQSINIDAHLPVRILFGYNGFRSEYNFRESFFKYLYQQQTIDFNNPIKGFGPHNFPNLIICSKYSMLKMNGMPFIGSIENDWWSFYVSSSYNPIYFFIETIWTRLAYKFDLPDSIFGDDLTMEPAHQFLEGKIQTKGSCIGWGYKYLPLSDEELNKKEPIREWAPLEIDEKQVAFFTLLGRQNEIDIRDKKFIKFVIEDGRYKDIDDFLYKLIDNGLIFIEGNMIRSLTKECACVYVKGKWFVGENCSGRLTRWAMKEESTE